MFESSSKMIMRLHHFYIIRALLEIQRKCNLWYSRFKCKIVFSLNRRLHSIGFPMLRHNHSEDYEKRNADWNSHTCGHRVANGKPARGGQKFTSENNFCSQDQVALDLSELLTSQANFLQNSFTIPMQMLLMPFIANSHQATQQLPIKVGANQQHPSARLAGGQSAILTTPLMVMTSGGNLQLQQQACRVSPNQCLDIHEAACCDYQSFVTREGSRFKAQEQAYGPQSITLGVNNQVGQQRRDRPNGIVARQNFWSTSIGGKLSAGSGQTSRLLLRNPLICS